MVRVSVIVRVYNGKNTLKNVWKVYAFYMHADIKEYRNYLH